MDDDDSRRFTDREVALVLKRASEVEQREAGETGRGLSLRDLREIAREVGISHEALTRAVRSLDRGRVGELSLAGAPLVQQAVHAVPCPLDEETRSRMIRIIDENASGAGAVSEALGAVRWTSSERFRSTQVSLTPEGGETVIHVVEKAAPHLRPLSQLIPAGWGGVLALGVVGSLGAVVGASVVLAGAVAGAAAGRLYWSWLSARSGRRVDRLASVLAAAAQRAEEGRE